jgi:spore coat protein U-like protein
MRNAKRSLHVIAVMIVWTMQSLFVMENVSAGSNTDGLNVSSSVAANCVIQGGLSNLTLNFGDYTTISSPLQVNGTMQLRCVRGTPAQIGLDGGIHSSNAVGSTRAMSNGAGSYLSYEIFTSAGRTTVWTNAVTVPYLASTSGAVSISLYATVLENQDVTTGIYTDNVQVTVSF